MKTLKTTRLKPNPAGKDSQRGQASQTQLGAEWIDVKNETNQPLNINGVELYHIAYSPEHPNGQYQRVHVFSETLPAGYTLRLHSGSGPTTALRTEDMQGAEIHRFTGRDWYVWNNSKGDCAALTMQARFEPFDKSCYDANSPESVVLVRVGDKLVPSAAPAAAYAHP